jgi:DNA-binding SARP family transcriptional activator
MPDAPRPASVRDLLAMHGDAEPLLRAVVELGPCAIATSTVDDWEAVAVVLRAGDRYPAAMAWRAGYALYHLGHTERAEHFFEHADRDELDDAERAQFCAAWASSAWGSGDADRSEALGLEAFEAAERSGDDAALTWAWESRAMLASMHGEPRANLHAHQRALDHAEAAGDTLMESRIRNNLGSVLFDQARYPEALDQFEHALRLANGVGHLSSIALIRHNVADVMLNLGRIDEALVEVEAARAIWAGLESPMVGAAWQLLADIQRARGNTAQAAMAYREAVAVAEESDDTQTLVPALTGSALIQVATDPAGAEATARRLLSLPSAVGLLPGNLTVGWVVLHSGDTEAATSYAEQALSEASQRHARAWLAEALELAALSADDNRQAQLQEAASIWQEIGNPIRLQVNRIVQAHLFGSPFTEQLARSGLRSLGVQEDAYGIAGPLHAIGPRAGGHPVHVHVLGAFVLSLHGRPVTSSEWPSRKARDILKVLAGRGAKGIRREALADLLWPDDPDPGSKLSVALSQLKRVLDPGKAYGPDHFVHADRVSIRLEMDHVAVDVADFVVAAQESLAAASHGNSEAIEMLEAAAAMHTGEFLEEDLAEDWPAEIRDEVESLGVEVIRVLAFALQDGGDPGRAVPWFARLLSYDPFDESIYAALLRVLTAAGRHGEARRHHHAYVLRMREIGVPSMRWEDMAA